jgi:hypothetical protein
MEVMLPRNEVSSGSTSDVGERGETSVVPRARAEAQEAPLGEAAAAACAGALALDWCRSELEAASELGRGGASEARRSTCRALEAPARGRSMAVAKI